MIDTLETLYDHCLDLVYPLQRHRARYSILNFSDLRAAGANLLRLYLFSEMHEIATFGSLSRFQISAFGWLQLAQKICALQARRSIIDAVATKQRQSRAWIASPLMSATLSSLSQPAGALSTAAAASLCFERAHKSALKIKTKPLQALLATPIHTFNGLIETLDCLADLFPDWIYGSEFVDRYENVLPSTEAKTYWASFKELLLSPSTKALSPNVLSKEISSWRCSGAPDASMPLFKRLMNADLVRPLYQLYPDASCLPHIATLLNLTAPPQDCQAAMNAFHTLEPHIRFTPSSKETPALLECLTAAEESFDKNIEMYTRKCHGEKSAPYHQTNKEGLAPFSLSNCLQDKRQTESRKICERVSVRAFRAARVFCPDAPPAEAPK